VIFVLLPFYCVFPRAALRGGLPSERQTDNSSSEIID
jgi:hypothetical protein